MQTQISIDRQALQHNIRLLKAHVGRAAFLAVVKANAYGHGLALVALLVQPYVDAYGVYTISEAQELRDIGVTQPIHLIGSLPVEEMDQALSLNAIVPLWNSTGWQSDLRAAARRRDLAAQVQIKIDTGLSRLGIDPQQTLHFLTQLQAENALRVVGAYSHIAAAEELDSRFTLDQLELFEQAIPSGAVPQRHIAASAAAMLWPQTRLDLVRIGIALYGIWPSRGTQVRLEKYLPLQPVLSWHTRFVAIREVEAETPVGYGCTYRPATDTRIGILPIGYAEGLPRSLSNCGEVLVEGQRCPIVGRICMNMTFIDLAESPQAHQGSRVTLIGSDGQARITAEDLAHHANTIGYEIVARLPSNIPRSITP